MVSRDRRPVRPPLSGCTAADWYVAVHVVDHGELRETLYAASGRVLTEYTGGLGEPPVDALLVGNVAEDEPRLTADRAPVAVRPVVALLVGV